MILTKGLYEYMVHKVFLFRSAFLVVFPSNVFDEYYDDTDSIRRPQQTYLSNLNKTVSENKVRVEYET